MSKTVLVTGAAGFIASHLIECLLRSGAAVIGVDNFEAFYPREVKEANLRHLHSVAKSCCTTFEFYEQSILDKWNSAISGRKISQVVHLAARAGVRPSLEMPEAYVETNITGTLRVLEFCRQNDISEMVFGSSSSVYGNSTPVPFSEDAIADTPISPYAATKRAGEHFCVTYAHLYGLKIAALRFFTVYGPRQRPDLAIHKFAKLIYDGKPITLFGDGTTSRDYTYVTDIIAGVRSSMDWLIQAEAGSYEVFNLGGSISTPLKQLVEMLESGLGRKAVINWAEAQPGDVERTFANLQKSRRLLNYEPQVVISEGIALFAKWFLEGKKA